MQQYISSSWWGKDRKNWENMPVLRHADSQDYPQGKASIYNVSGPEMQDKGVLGEEEINISEDTFLFFLALLYFVC